MWILDGRVRKVLLLLIVMAAIFQVPVGKSLLGTLHTTPPYSPQQLSLQLRTLTLKQTA